MKIGLMVFVWIISVLITSALMRDMRMDDREGMVCKIIQEEPDYIEECRNAAFRFYIVNYDTYYVEKYQR